MAEKHWATGLTESQKKDWMKIRSSVLEKAEYYRSIGKDKEWMQLETHVKGMDYGVDMMGTRYKKLSKSQLNKLMDSDPEPEKLPTASIDVKRGAIDVSPSEPKKPLKIAERLRENLKKVAESDARALRETNDLLQEVAEMTGSKLPPIDVKATTKKLENKDKTVEKAGALVVQPPSTPVAKGGAIVPSIGGALSKSVGPSAPKKPIKIAERLRQNLSKVAKSDARQLRGMESTIIDSRDDDDWEGDINDHRDIPWAQRGIDDLRSEIDKDPSIPFGKDKTPWYDDITGLMKSRDQAIEDEKEEENRDAGINPEVVPAGSSAGDNAIPTADGKKKRRKTRGKGPVKRGKGFGNSIPKGKGTKSGLKDIAKNIADARKALFGLFKVEKDRFKLRKGIQKRLDTKVGAKKAEDRVEKDPDAPDLDENMNDGRYQKPEESSFDKAVKGGIFSGLFVAAMPLVVEGLRPFFEEQADTLEKIAPEEDQDTKEDESAVGDAEKDSKTFPKESTSDQVGGKMSRQERDNFLMQETPRINDPKANALWNKAEGGGAASGNFGGSTEINNNFFSGEGETDFDEFDRVSDYATVNGKRPGEEGYKKHTLSDSTKGAFQKDNPHLIGNFAEGGKITPTRTGTPNLKNTDGIQKPLQQLTKKDLESKGQRALNKFIQPIKNVFQLPNIVARRSLGLGKKALSATSKIAGAAFKMTPFGMAMGLTRGMRGKSGKDGKSWEEYKNSRRYQQRQERIEALRNDPTATRTMTVNGKQVAPEAMDSMLTLKDQRVNKLRAKRDFANPLGGLMKDAKERGVGGVLGGVADAFTGNIFDFDGKNVKPGRKASKELDKGESQSDKMVKVINTLNSVSSQISVVKQQNSSKRINMPVQTTSKMSQSAIDAALQPGL